ncbi:Diaminopimelate decarboxylase [Bacillus safensis subsp. safensis]
MNSLVKSCQKSKVLLRITPGVEAHTHDYITTGQEDSKFGFDLHNGQADEAVKQVLGSEVIELFRCSLSYRFTNF